MYTNNKHQYIKLVTKLYCTNCKAYLMLMAYTCLYLYLAIPGYTCLYHHYDIFGALVICYQVKVSKGGFFRKWLFRNIPFRK